MDLQIFFHWHKLLHFAFPVIVIVSLQKKLGLLKVCFILFIAGFLKEVYDTIVHTDPLWISFIDMVLTLFGIIFGIVIVNLKNKLEH